MTQMAAIWGDLPAVVLLPAHSLRWRGVRRRRLGTHCKLLTVCSAENKCSGRDFSDWWSVRWIGSSTVEKSERRETDTLMDEQDCECGSQRRPSSLFPMEGRRGEGRERGSKEEVWDVCVSKKDWDTHTHTHEETIPVIVEEECESCSCEVQAAVRRAFGSFNHKFV